MRPAAGRLDGRFPPVNSRARPISTQSCHELLSQWNQQVTLCVPPQGCYRLMRLLTAAGGEYGHNEYEGGRAGEPQRGRSGGGEVGINPHLEVVRNVMNFAIRKGYYKREHPFQLRGQRVTEFAKEKGRSRRLQPGEEEKLIAPTTS